MSVLIKGMEMPESCEGCRFAYAPNKDSEYGHFDCTCAVTGELIAFDGGTGERLCGNPCPLDEVPDDGVVISEDEFRTYSRAILVALTLRDLLVSLDSFAEVPKYIEPVANAPADKGA